MCRLYSAQPDTGWRVHFAVVGREDHAVIVTGEYEGAGMRGVKGLFM